MLGCCSGSDDGSLVRRDAKLKTPLLCSSALNLSFRPSCASLQGLLEQEQQMIHTKDGRRSGVEDTFCSNFSSSISMDGRRLEPHGFCVPRRCLFDDYGKKATTKKKPKGFFAVSVPLEFTTQKNCSISLFNKIKCFRQSTLGFSLWNSNTGSSIR